jgi:hypothetical protein
MIDLSKLMVKMPAITDQEMIIALCNRVKYSLRTYSETNQNQRDINEFQT